jgi:pyrimidine operon attenuation protein/uracil phosphoribosyltransferase
MNRAPAKASRGRLILNGEEVAAKIHALEAEILKEFKSDLPMLALVGIQTRGAHLARRMAEHIKLETGQDVPVGILDITLYRDDVHDIADQPAVKETDLPFDIHDRAIVLIDDVLFTGRTVRSAMNALIDYGRPRCIRLAVLVDRGHRELPVGADYAGLLTKTAREDIIDVNLKEVDGEDSVRLRKSEASNT